MAIAFGTANGGQSTNSLSLLLAGGSSNYYILGFLIGDLTNTNPTMNWNTTESMTLLGTNQLSGDRFIYAFGLANPTTGNLNLTTSGSTFHEMFAVYYTGCSATQPDSVATPTPSGSGTNTFSTTVVKANSWLAMFTYGASGNAITAGSGTTLRGSVFDGATMADSNGTVGTGSQSLNLASFGNANNHPGIIVSLAPFTASTNNDLLIMIR